VTKTGLFVTSFVAAIPGAWLAYLMVMAFLNYSGGPSMWSKALAGMLFVIGTLLMLMPAGIFVFAGPRAEKAPKKPKEEAAEGAGSAVVEAESGEAVVEAAEGEEGSGERAAVTDPNLEVVDSSAEDFGMSGELVGAGEAAEDDSDFEVNTAQGGSEVDLFEDEEEEPKKGKKK
jgi:hypothetical protein